MADTENTTPATTGPYDIAIDTLRAKQESLSDEHITLLATDKYAAALQHKSAMRKLGRAIHILKAVSDCEQERINLEKAAE